MSTGMPVNCLGN